MRRNLQNIFLNALFGAAHPHTPLWHRTSGARTSDKVLRESHSAGAVRGDKHCPLRTIGALPCVENQGFCKADFPKGYSFNIIQNEEWII
jgi:hypothetical protein